LTNYRFQMMLISTLPVYPALQPDTHYMRSAAFDVSSRRFTASQRPSGAEAVAVVEPPSLAHDLRELLKPGISLFVSATAAAGYLFGASADVDSVRLLALLVGTALTAGGSGALNHVLERTPDGRMARTRGRPLPAGRLSPTFAFVYGITVVSIGLGLLYAFTNPLTATLALGTAVGYVAVYTPLKRHSWLNTFVGAVPGALPALGGYAAATATIGAGGWAAFAIVYLWQLPHFFALAWMFRDDYARGGFVMLPVTRPDGFATAGISLAATLLLLIAGVVPVAIGLMGWIYLAGMLTLGTLFTIPAFAFATEPTDLRARRLLLASIAYVPAFLILVVFDFALC
jgi:heme o synthase